MGGPSWTGDQVAVHYGVGHFYCGVGAARVFYFRGAGWITAEALAFDHVRGGENLRAVAQRGDGFIGFGEVAYDFEKSGFRAQIFWITAYGDYQGVVIFGMHLGEGGVQRE